MNLAEIIASIVLLATALTTAWLLGYHRGVESMRRDVVQRLRYRARLHSLPAFRLGTGAAERASALREAADGIERVVRR